MVARTSWWMPQFLQKIREILCPVWKQASAARAACEVLEGHSRSLLEEAWCQRKGRGGSLIGVHQHSSALHTAKPPAFATVDLKSEAVVKSFQCWEWIGEIRLSSASPHPPPHTPHPHPFPPPWLIGPLQWLTWQIEGGGFLTGGHFRASSWIWAINWYVYSLKPTCVLFLLLLIWFSVGFTEVVSTSQLSACSHFAFKLFLFVYTP